MRVKKDRAIKPSGRKGFARKSSWQLYSMCAIPVILVFLFNYLPMGGLVLAFKDYRYDKGIFGSDWVGLKNFKFFFETDTFSRITFNTLFMNFLFIVTGVACSVGLAILLFELRSRRATKVFQTALIVPNFISWVIAAYMVFALLSPRNGVLNVIIEQLGGQKIDWYSKPEAWIVILTICNLWKNVGIDSVVYYASLMGVDMALFEAADIDGATKWQKIKYIIIPSLGPVISILTILKIGNIFRADFGLFYNVTRNVGTLYQTTDVIDTYIYRTMQSVGNMGMSSAVGLLQSIVGFILVMITNYVTKKIDPDRALY